MVNVNIHSNMKNNFELLLKKRGIAMEHLPKELKEEYEYSLKSCSDLDIDSSLINVSDILKAYYILADYFTDDSVVCDEAEQKMLVGVRSYNLLASAIGRQNVEYNGVKKYTDKIEICSTLFFGLVKDHAFHDGNKRTALLILLYQLQLYGFYPKPNFKEFERLVVAVADNSLPIVYEKVWKKFCKGEDCEIKTISFIVRRLVTKRNMSYHLSITTKEFCSILQRNGVRWILDGQKIRLYRDVKKFLKTDQYTYTINFYGWTRPVKVKMARDTVDALHLTEEYPNFESLSNGEGNIYKTICEFEMPLRRLKDE